MILWLLKLGITMLIHNKDDIEFVTEFPCFFGTPCTSEGERSKMFKKINFVVILISFEFDMFCRLINFVG